MRIKAVFFDMGGTLEDIRFDRSSRLAATGELLSLLEGEGIHVGRGAEVVLDSIERGCAVYRAHSERAMRELPPAEIWRDYYLADFGLKAEDAERLAERLAWLWETRFYTRSLRPGAHEAVAALKERGYSLGIISNTSSRSQVPAMLEGYGLLGYFACVCLSSVSGVRKPDPAIFREAASLLGVDVSEAAYVGDTVSRDISGAHAAGYALSFKIESFVTRDRDAALPPGCPRPDHVIDDLREIASVLDGIQAPEPQGRRP